MFHMEKCSRNKLTIIIMIIIIMITAAQFMYCDVAGHQLSGLTTTVIVTQWQNTLTTNSAY